MFTKDNEAKVINMQLFYEGAEAQAVAVSDEVYQFLVEQQTYEESRARKDRRYVLNFEFNDAEIGERDGKFSLSAEDILFRTNEIGVLTNAVEQLPDYDKMLIRLYYYRQQNIMKISEAIDVPKTTVARHLKKAVDKLSVILQKIM